MTEATALKDLDDAAFEARYASDRFTASVLSNRMRYIVQHMCTGLLNNAFSLILRDLYGFAANVREPTEQNYPMAWVGNSLALFPGTMSEAVRNSSEEYGPEILRHGDVIICSDPYRAGNHVNGNCSM